MTLKQYLRDIAGAFVRVVAPHLRKWSTWIGGADVLIVYPTLFSLLPFVDERIIFGIAFAFAVAKFIVGLFPQKRVKTFDPTTHEVIAKRKRSAGDE